MQNKLKKYSFILFPIAILVAIFLLVSILWALLPKISSINTEVVIEAGSLSVITENQFKAKPDAEVELLTDLTKIDLKKTGNHTVELAFMGRNYVSNLHIVDTTAPTATEVDKQIYLGETLTADSFVTEIKDCSDVTVEFSDKPDFTKIGEQTVTVLIKDAAGNSVQKTAKLTILKDTTPPIFEGLKTVSVRVGESVSYRKDVTVTDDRDTEVKFTFDNSAVNLQKEGEYKVIYTATDSSGNTATAERTVKVLPKLIIDEAYVKGLAKKVVDKIISKDMTKAQKADKIFRWVRNNINYVSSPESDIVNAAYVAFEKKRGDCFNFYSVTKLLLDECEIENMMVERYGGKTTHFWHLVNVGTGWYHFDTTPQSIEDPYRCFMKTDEQVWAYAKSRSDGRSDYYNFDTTKYPERATVKFG